MFTPWSFSPLVLRPALWLDASDASTLWDATSGGSLVAAGGSVVRWEDKSGNARHATQSTGINQPTRQTGITNGRDIVRFDGSNDFLVCGSGYTATAHTTFVVAKYTTTGAFRTPFYYGNASTLSANFNWVGLSRTSTDKLTSGNFNNPTDRPATSTTSLNTTDFYIGTGIVNDSGTNRMILNGVQEATSTSTTISLNAAARPTIGRRGTDALDYMIGDIAEIITFNTALSSANRQAVESYLKAKWGTA